MQITVHLGLLVLAGALAFSVGLLFRWIQVKLLRKQLLELEKEKMDDHAEILSLQRKLSDSVNSSHPAATPVVSLKEKDSQTDNGKNKLASQ
ncbi:hypothetical protein [Flavihumibacter solisilvae]|uniref:Lipopolysaccharide assembly protein A domain-containing protein n=1 Tax=Flavihumibacter solisilvae TaxID=1349421 RepID=A0A0C1J068_9BACT|nr:hypothetical protein [Flavihumibacter solisilvae]KIC96149.1 hypothetical protein OI18_03045 [Flavihumibacter solisilvae]